MHNSVQQLAMMVLFTRWDVTNTDCQPDTGILKQLPVPASLIRESNYAPYQSHLLALTKSKLFIHVTVSLNAPNLMFSYDLGTGEWDEGYDDISGKWSAGVLYDDRYLFAFGTQNPKLPPATMIKGLPTDGTVLPYVYETHDYEEEPDMYETRPGYTPYLFQVGKENDHKLALLWESERPNPESGLPQCLLFWSKFILNPITIDAATVDPHVYVSSLSNGFAALDEGTRILLNCAAGM
ncbi:hypothetical protein ACLB2K_002655 [Fragaria x ananassa]